MTEITMHRADYEVEQNKCEHAGLMLERGFAEWDSEKYNAQKADFYDKLTAIKASDLYEQAYQRWEDYLQHDSTHKLWYGKLLNTRLYLGLGEASPLESAITLQHTYGVPFIPGSAIKGVVHHALLAHFAHDYNAQKKQYRLQAEQQIIIDTLFGREPDEHNKQDAGEAGYITFNDAWWVPGSKAVPLVKEIITVHHQEYYAGKAAATDFDSPNPNPQLAIQGSFLFSVQGEKSWAEYVIKVLQQVLENKGIGAKTASGYGYFIAEQSSKQKTAETWENVQLGLGNVTGLGRVIEANFAGKKAREKCDNLQSFMQQLSKGNKKKLNKHALQRTIKVQKEGNFYHILEIFFEEKL